MASSGGWLFEFFYNPGRKLEKKSEKLDLKDDIVKGVGNVFAKYQTLIFYILLLMLQ